MKVDKSLMAGSTAMLVMNLLSEGEMYGYQMIKELAGRSDDTFVLKEGTLYPILHDLERRRLLASSVKEASGGRTRKYYRLTEAGRESLTEKKAEWRFFSEKVNQVVFPVTEWRLL